jgi:hypothetical protein
MAGASLPTLLGGVAWLDDEFFYTAGRDGRVYRVTTDGTITDSKEAHTGRVRLVLGSGSRFLTADGAGVAFIWTDNLLRHFATTAVQSTAPAAYAAANVVAGIGTDLHTWDLSTLVNDPAFLVKPSGPGGRLDVVLKVGKPRAAWVSPDGLVELFNPIPADGAAVRGAVQCPVEVLLVVSSGGGNTFDLVCADGTFRRHRFPEELAAAPVAFGKPTVAQKFTRKANAGWLVSAGRDDRFAYVLDVAGGTVANSGVAVPNDSGDSVIVAVTISADGQRAVTLLSEKSGLAQRNRVLHANKPTQVGAAWVDFAPGAPIFMNAEPGSLAVSDSGATAAVVATAVAGTTPKLYRLDLTTPGTPGKPMELAGNLNYKVTQHVTFLPGDENSWLLLLGKDTDATLRTLRKVTGNATTGATTTVEVFQGPDNSQLTAAPVALPVTGGVYVASAWSDKKVHVHLLKSNDTIGDAFEAAAVDATALALSPGTPPRLACLTREGQVRVWNVDKTLVELERFTPKGTPAAGAPALGWHDDAVVLGTLDGTNLLQAEVFNPSFVKAYPIPTTLGADLTSAKTAAVRPDSAVVAVADNAGNVAFANVSAAGAPTVAANSFPVAAKVWSVEFLSERDLALVQMDNQVIFYHADAAALPTFARLSLAPAFPPDSREVFWLRRVSAHQVLVGTKTVETLLTIPDPPDGLGATLTVGPDRFVRSVGRPAVVKVGANDPWAVGFEQVKENDPHTLKVRAATVDGVGKTPVGAPPGDGLKAITAAAWAGEDTPVLGLADGRLWARPAGAGAYQAFPAQPSPNGAAVLALARSTTRSLFAFVLSLEATPNLIHLRDPANPGVELSPPLQLNAGAPPTSLAFSPANDLLAAGTSGGKILVWSLPAAPAAPVPLASNLAADSEVQDLAFFRSDELGATNRLAALSRNGGVKVWEFTVDHGAVKVAKLGSAWVNGSGASDDRRARLSWSPDGKSIAVATQDGKVVVLKPTLTP